MSSRLNCSLRAAAVLICRLSQAVLCVHRSGYPVVPGGPEVTLYYPYPCAPPAAAVWQRSGDGPAAVRRWSGDGPVAVQRSGGGPVMVRQRSGGGPAVVRQRSGSGPVVVR